MLKNGINEGACRKLAALIFQSACGMVQIPQPWRIQDVPDGQGGAPTPTVGVQLWPKFSQNCTEMKEIGHVPVSRMRQCVVGANFNTGAHLWHKCCN